MSTPNDMLDSLRVKLAGERDREAQFACRFAARLDEIKPAPGDQRYCLLAQSHGIINGLDIALAMISEENELD